MVIWLYGYMVRWLGLTSWVEISYVNQFADNKVRFPKDFAQGVEQNKGLSHDPNED